MSELMTPDESAIVARARLEVDRGVTYDATYTKTSGYPNGDVPLDRGACTDVVIRSLRTIGVDLQSLVYEDIRTDPAAYGIDEPNPHIDHRRVSTLFIFMVRNTRPLTTNVRNAESFRPGDIVFFAKRRGALPVHVGIVSDRIGPHGYRLVLQNGGPRATEADSLSHAALAGHFRISGTNRAAWR
jgi:uncharacterized protein YijF (DUF1287 family)